VSSETIDPDGLVPGLTTAARWTAGRKTVALALALIAASAATIAIDGLPGLSAVHPRLDWWTIALLSMVGQLVVLHVEVRRETYTFAITEVPMVLGLVFATPIGFLAGRFLGELLVLAVKERQRGRRLLLNLASYVAEGVTLVVVYRAAGAPSDIERPTTWLIVLLAVLVAQLVGFLVVAKVIAWHGAPVDIRSILGVGLLIAPVNTSLGITAAVLLLKSPWTTLLLSSVALFLIASYRSYERLGERYSSLSLLYDFTRFVSGSRSPDGVLEAILTHSKELLVAERAEIWLTDGGHLVGLCVSAGGLSPAHVPAGADALFTRWFGDQTNAILSSSDGRNGDPLIARALGARECIVAPITESGAVIGLIAAVDRLGEVTGFRPRDLRLFTTIATHASAALENGRMIDRLHDEARAREHEALHDPLTGLANRVLFGERLRDELDAADHDTLPHSGPVVGLLDLDGFKQINDTFGHHWGDEVLVEVARRMVRVVDPAITVARLGGDEFAILIPAIGAEELEPLARRIRAAVGAPLSMPDGRAEIGISIGLARYTDRGIDGAVLMRRADAAMYRAKQAAKAGLGEGFALVAPGDDGLHA